VSSDWSEDRCEEVERVAGVGRGSVELWFFGGEGDQHVVGGKEGNAEDHFERFFEWGDEEGGGTG
jgi:hypothetical protein